MGALAVYLFVFEVMHSKVMNDSYAQQLYYQAMMYRASNYGEDIYDYSDDEYDYITDVAKIAPEFDKGGDAEIAFDKQTGDVVYAKWRHPYEGFADSFVSEYSVYP